MSTQDHKTGYGKCTRGQIPDDFADLVADHRACGRNDDEIARFYGITVDTLYSRFRRFGIPAGRRYRDIEDAQLPSPLTRSVWFESGIRSA